MTLTELLVVIMILAFLLGAALPVMRTALEDRAMREASRQLNTYIQVAKSQAAELGRPVGLWLETQALDEGIPSPSAPLLPPRYATQLFLAYTPPPYSGDFVGATIRVSSTVVSNDPVTGRPRYQAQFVNTTAVPPPVVDQIVYSANFGNLVGLGDAIKFDFKGAFYRIIDLTALPLITIEGETHEPPPPTGDVKYQVLRTPQKSSTNPMELGGGAVIDLSNSGVGLTGQEFASATAPIVIMFAPTGSVERVMGQGLPTVPPATIHLLVGSVADMMKYGHYSTSSLESPIPPAQRLAADFSRNLDNTANFWVSITHQTGSVVTGVNAWQVRTDLATSLAAARQFAQQGQAEGGR